MFDEWPPFQPFGDGWQDLHASPVLEEDPAAPLPGKSLKLQRRKIEVKTDI